MPPCFCGVVSKAHRKNKIIFRSALLFLNFLFPSITFDQLSQTSSYFGPEEVFESGDNSNLAQYYLRRLRARRGEYLSLQCSVTHPAEYI